MKTNNMKNSAIHNGLSQKEVRDFLAMQLMEIQINKNNNNSDYNNCHIDDDPFQSQINRDRVNIKYLTKNIKFNEQIKAVLILIEDNGWDEHDPSDNVLKDLPGYMSFIGTEKEYDILIKKIENLHPINELQERLDQLNKLDMKYIFDDQTYVGKNKNNKDFNVHMTEIQCDDDNEWDKKIEEMENLMDD